MVASEIETRDACASSWSISAVTWRSPFANNSQPSAILCRVGLNPADHSFIRISWNGHPAKAPSGAAGARRGFDKVGVSLLGIIVRNPSSSRQH